MFQSIRKWNRRRRQRRRGQNQFLGEHGYPVDMGDDCVETIARVKDYTMTTPERLNGLCEAVRYLTSAQIEGDVVECGVWKGGSMMAVAEMLGRFGDFQRELYLFDTFEGMVEPTEHDVSFRGDAAANTLENERSKDPEFRWCDSSLDEVRRHMHSTHYPKERMHFVRGMVEETIPEGAPEKIALLRLDTDWYESTRHELEHLFPRLADGGVLIIDDYGHWQGARRAVDEYFQHHQIAMLLNRLDYTGRIGIHHAGVRHTGRFNTSYRNQPRRAA